MLAGSAAGRLKGRPAHCHSGSHAAWRTSLPGSEKSPGSISASSRTARDASSSRSHSMSVPAKMRLALSDVAEVRPAPKLGGKRERTRKKILEAAFGLIGNEKGLTVRIEEICAAAHISRGTFYNYFTSLEQLFEVLAIELSHDLNRALVSTWDETQSHAEGCQRRHSALPQLRPARPRVGVGDGAFERVRTDLRRRGVGRVLALDRERHRGGRVRRAECDRRPRPDDGHGPGYRAHHAPRRQWPITATSRRLPFAACARSARRTREGNCRSSASGPRRAEVGRTGPCHAETPRSCSSLRQMGGALTAL